MTAREYLSRVRNIDRRMERKLEELERMEAFIYSGKRPSYSGMPRGKRADWTDAVDRYSELCDEYRDELQEMARIKREVRDAIDAVEDIRMRDILEYRYLSGYSWERIADVMNYDLRWVYRLHGRALKRVDEYLKRVI